MPSSFAGEGFVAFGPLKNAKDGHALHSARAVVDRELASCERHFLGSRLLRANGRGKILDVDGGFLSGLGYWLSGCIDNVFIGF